MRQKVLVFIEALCMTEVEGHGQIACFLRAAGRHDHVGQLYMDTSSRASSSKSSLKQVSLSLYSSYKREMSAAAKEASSGVMTRWPWLGSRRPSVPIEFLRRDADEEGALVVQSCTSSAGFTASRGTLLQFLRRDAKMTLPLDVPSTFKMTK
jgi:hypothetical protein